MVRNESSFSLLWPYDDAVRRKNAVFMLGKQAEKDLNLECVVSALAPHRADRAEAGDLLTTMLTDPEVILHRQRVFSDLFAHGSFRKALEELRYDLLAIRPVLRTSKDFEKSALYRAVNRIADLESYVRVVERLSGFASESGFSSGVFKDFVGWTVSQKNRKEFSALSERIPELAANMKSAASITIGVNLDAKLSPIEALILSVNPEKFTDRSPGFLSSLFGKTAPQYVGITPLHHPPFKKASAGNSSVDLDPAMYGYAVEPTMIPLFQDLAKLLEKSARPIDDALREFASVETHRLAGLARELPLVLRCADLFDALKLHGVPFCFPEILPREARTTDVRGSINMQLALASVRDGTGAISEVPPVANDVTFDDDGRILIITGPNQGGKTVFTQAIGLNQVLFQAGLPVPGTAGRMSPADSLFTHYQIEERPDEGTGRLGDEAKRIREIFSSATPFSMILMNESLSSTSPGESIYIARDVIRLLRRLGCRAVFTTHLHELAESADSFNEEPGSSAVTSMVSLVEENSDGSIRKTYRIVKGPPRGRSFAREVALRHGISFEQLEDLLAGRGVIERPT